VYRSSVKRRVAALLDSGGDLLFRPPRDPIPWKELKDIAVLRLDHLGDVVFALPAVEAICRALPKARVTLFVGPWCRKVAELSRLARVEVFEAPWFRRPMHRHWARASIEALALRLRGRFQAGIEFRGDLRHLMALAWAGIPWRVGQAIAGGRFLLTHPAEYDPRLHEIEQNLGALSQAGLVVPGREAQPRLVPGPEDEVEASRVFRRLRSRRPVVAFQVTCGAEAKLWPAERWAEVLDRFPAGYDRVLLGSENERGQTEAVATLCRRKPLLATGLLSIPGLAAFLKRCRLLVSLDSGPAHLAAAVGTPVLGLFSANNELAQWMPRGPRVLAIQKSISCSPCGLAACPFDNECMRLIGTAEVLQKARLLLGGTHA
jgi:ADP-heptose:LPS heptosyltransferase